MITVTRRLEFDAGHRLKGHEGGCRFIHGHHYVVEITVSGQDMDKLGRVVDFSVIKKRVGSWIDSNWDHNMLLNREDKYLLEYFEDFEERDPFLFDGNPTAENMAKVLYEIAVALLAPLIVRHIRVYETPNCWADFTPVFPLGLMEIEEVEDHT